MERNRKIGNRYKAEKENERVVQWHSTDKQQLALAKLSDPLITEVLYGGAAGGAKTFLGCAWLITCCHVYPGSRWLMGRASLKQLRHSTLLTFFDVCKMWGLKRDIDYKFNGQDGVITFLITGAEIYLKDLMHYPSDPDYDSLGSTEYTGAFIDEASQITQKAKNVVASRLRYKIDEFDITPKLLMTCNPTKNFLYTEFYKPWKDKSLPPYKCFIQSKVQDNPFLPESYITSLKNLDNTSRERLLNGNWEYDDDPSSLVAYDALTDMFTNTLADQPIKTAENQTQPRDMRKRYIVCDVARFGADRTVITIWYGLECVAIFTYAKTSMTTVAELLKEKMAYYNVPASQVIVDEDGIGGGVKDIMYGIKGFTANARPFNGENYNHVKSQCAFLLASHINARTIAMRTDNDQLKLTIIEECEQLKIKDMDKDGKKSIVSKDKMKEYIGRSPDILDCLIMRMYFEFMSQPKLTFL